MKVKFSDVLKPGSIWKTKARGRLIMVLCITNLNMNQDKNPSQVVFRYGSSDVVSCDLKTFKNSMKYVRQDEVGASIISDIFFHDITGKEQTVVEPDTQEEEEESPQELPESEGVYYGLDLEVADSNKKVCVSQTDLNTSFAYYNYDNNGTVSLGFLPDTTVTLDTLYRAFAERNSDETYYNKAHIIIDDDKLMYDLSDLTPSVHPMIVNGCVVFVVHFEKKSVVQQLPSTSVVEDTAPEVTEDIEITQEQPVEVIQDTQPEDVEVSNTLSENFEEKLPKQVQQALKVEPTEDIVKKVELALDKGE